MTREDVLRLGEGLLIIFLIICFVGVVAFSVELSEAYRNAEPIPVISIPVMPPRTVADARQIIQKIRMDNETFYIDTRSGRTWYRPDGLAVIIEIDPIASVATLLATQSAEALPQAGN